MTTTTEAKPKRKNLARRERLNPDWPISIYKWDCWPMGADGKPCAMPDHLWQTAHLMRQLWNDLCDVFERASALDTRDEDGKPARPKEERAALYFPFGQRKTAETEKNAKRYATAREVWGGSVPSLHEIGCSYRGALPSACYEFVVSRFILTVKAWQKNPALNGPPKRKRRLDKIKIPLVFNEGRPLAWLSEGGEGAPVQARYTEHLKPGPNEEPSLEYLLNGWFDIGVERERVNLHVAQHRELPSKGRIKAVSLVGVFERAFQWSWSLQVQFEHPPLASLPRAGRVAGLDLGWRALEDGVRAGVIADSDGNAVEIFFPFCFANREQRKERRFDSGDYGKVTDVRDFADAQAHIDAKKDAVKARLDNLSKREEWPEEARAIWQGKAKIGVGGLFRLLAALDPASESYRELSEWAAGYKVDHKRLRGAETRFERIRNDVWRKVAAWMAANYDAIAWEGDLGLKGMAEESRRQKEARKAEFEATGQWPERTVDERILEASQQWRHRMSPSLQRQYLRESMRKHGRELADRKAARSTQTCPVCGGHVEASRKILGVCENGHQTDQDERAATNLLNTLESPASASDKPLEIPAELRRYLRRLA
jgi:hypothetical protein